ncbi:hypothetical protein D3C80_1451450 [compost metagenome]
MIALPTVLHDQLPVGVFGKYRGVGDLGVFQIMGCQHRFEMSAEFAEVRHVIRQCDKDHSRHHFATKRDKVVPMWLEIGRHVFGENQVAFKVVGPLVIRADQPSCRAFFAGTNHGSAMPAGIEIGAHRTF